MKNQLNKNKLAYGNYLFARKKVLTLISNKKSHDTSNYWKEELEGFDYMLDATPLIINKLRHHCYHITGLREYDYRNHHIARAKSFKNKLNFLKKYDHHNLFIPESPILGGFGHKIKNYLVNIDTLKFYECLITLDNNGFLDRFRKKDKRIVLEIGAGWGGFAYQFKKIFPNILYIIVDLPEVFLFSYTYLKTIFPKAQMKFAKEGENINNFLKYDFVFIPNYLWNDIKIPTPDLAVNLVSFQEMTNTQVENYIKKCVSLGCKNLYSLNRDKSFYNNQLSSLSSLFSNYYKVKDITPFEVDYTELSTNPDSKLWVKVSKKILDTVFFERRKKRSLRYKHLFGSLE